MAVSQPPVRGVSRGPTKPPVDPRYDESSGLYGGFPVIASLWAYYNAANRGEATNQWDDLSGNDRHMTSASAGEFPSFAGGIATFDGTTDHLDLPSMSAFTAGEILFRVKLDADTPAEASSGLWDMGSSSETTHFPYIDTNHYNEFGTTVRKASSGSAVDLSAAFRTVDVWSASGDWALLVDATTEFSTATNTVGFIAAPSFGFGGGYYLKGQVKAIAIFDAKLGTADRAAVKSFMDGL